MSDQQEVGGGATCPQCGNPTPAGGSFCRKCGASLAAPGIAASQPGPSGPVATPMPVGQPAQWSTASAGGAVTQGNGFGIAALVLGIVGFSSLLCGLSILSSILAIVFGAIGRNKAKQGLATNGGMATAGLVLGVAGVALFGALMLFALMLPES